MRAFLAFVLTCTFALPVQAQSDEFEHFAESLQMSAVIEILQEEGIGFGRDLGTEMFTPGQQEEWEQTLNSIYNADWMYDVTMAGVAEALEGADLAAITDFFDAPLGKQIVTLEISGRRALMDEEIEQAATETAKAMQAKGGARVELVQRFIDVNNLLDANVVGSLNSNYAFSIGLMDGGFFPDEVTQSEILNEVWGQETQITAETQEWLMTYLLLAYQPLSDEELKIYVDWSATPDGQALNEALFRGFDTMFDEISYALGFAAGLMIQAPQEL